MTSKLVEVGQKILPVLITELPMFENFEIWKQHKLPYNSLPPDFLTFRDNFSKLKWWNWTLIILGGFSLNHLLLHLISKQTNAKADDSNFFPTYISLDFLIFRFRLLHFDCCFEFLTQSWLTQNISWIQHIRLTQLGRAQPQSQL